MKKILYVLLHGAINPQRHTNVVNGWAKNVDYLFYSDHDNEEKNIIKISNRSDYYSNEEKHVNSIHCVNYNKKGYEWYFFCDDDTFVNTKKLESFLETIDINSVHGSVLKGTWPYDPNLRYCSGGAGYLIHHTLLPKISDNIKLLNTGFSDVTLGIFLRQLGIDVVNHVEFKTEMPKYYGIKTEDLNKYITFHRVVNESDMNYLMENL